jgi:rare lipoprotein A
MNQHRLTCLSTVVITAFSAPIATVCSKIAPVLAVEPVGNEYQALPRPLPIITPLIVTELETDVAVPTASTIIPQPNRKATVSSGQKVGQIPSIQPATVPTASTIIPQPNRTATVSSGQKVGQIPSIQPPPASSQSVSTLSALDSTFKVTAPVLSGSNFIDSFTTAPQPISTLPPVNPTLPTSGVMGSLPSPTSIESADTQPVKVRVVSPSVFVMRNAGSQLKAIITNSTIEAETTGSTPVAVTSPQMSSSSDSPTFIAGLPTFSFDTDRPQQIVATAVAEIDNTVAASQTTTAIPVQRSEPFSSPETAPPNKSGKLIAYRSNSQPPQSIIDRIVATQIGKASWYGAESGPKTASGERFNPNALTAAHRTLPFGTKVRVTSIKTGKSVVVRINDRGPFHTSRILDVSVGAAQAIGIKKDGIGQIRMEVLSSTK